MVPEAMLHVAMNAARHILEYGQAAAHQDLVLLALPITEQHYRSATPPPSSSPVRGSVAWIREHASVRSRTLISSTPAILLQSQLLWASSQEHAPVLLCNNVLLRLGQAGIVCSAYLTPCKQETICGSTTLSRFLTTARSCGECANAKS